eukprot:scaffold197733_cov12-Tisochrysis_lutea.AAC.1
MNANRIILILGCTNSTPDTSFLLIALEGYNAFQFSKLSARVYPLRKQHHILVRNQKFANHASVWHNVCHAIPEDRDEQERKRVSKSFSVLKCQPFLEDCSLFRQHI